MEEASCIDLGQNANICITSIHDSSKALNMDMNLEDTLLELDAEDIADIYHMVSDWEFNFGSLEGSDKEELLTLVQIEASPQQHRGSNCHNMVSLSTNTVEIKQHLSSINNTKSELHDRLPSYYTALASSRTAPWMHSSNQIFNKLPAYITDVAGVDVLTGGPCEEDAHRQTGKKKLNLAEYRNRREKLMKQQEGNKNEMPNKQLDVNKSSEQCEQVIVSEHHSHPCSLDSNQEQNLSEITPSNANHQLVEEKPLQETFVSKDETKSVANTVMVKVSESSSLATSDNGRDNYKNHTQSTRTRRKSSRSPTRSNSSRSSRSRSPSLPRRRHRHPVRSSSRSSTSSSSSSSRSRSRSRSRSPPYRSRRRRVSRSRSPSWKRSRSYGRRSRSSSPRCQYSSDRRRNPYETRDAERQRQIEERRVIYVGKISEGTTRADLRRRFEIFGPIVDVSLHFRDRGDNYGFVTFAYKVDAYEAVEHGNDDPNLPRYDLSFGGRRSFCKEKYADLDAVDEGRNSKANDVDFETLLRAVQAQLHRRPCS